MKGTDIITQRVIAELYTCRQSHNSSRRKVIKILTEYFSVLVTNGPATHLSEIPRMAEALAGRLWRPKCVHQDAQCVRSSVCDGMEEAQISWWSQEGRGHNHSYCLKVCRVCVWGSLFRNISFPAVQTHTRSDWTEMGRDNRSPAIYLTARSPSMQLWWVSAALIR